MVCKIPVRGEGKIDGFDMLLRGMTQTASLNSSLKLHWLTVVRGVVEIMGGSLATNDFGLPLRLS